MSKFNVGDKVLAVKGVQKGKTGVVTNPGWQISQSDWPLVLFTDEDGNRCSSDEDFLELAEDPYEYACVRYYKTGEIYPETIIWEDKTSAENDVKFMGGSSKHYDYRLKKRRKAGEMEDV